MPGKDRTGKGASTARSTPAGTNITPRGLARLEATFAMTLLVARPALAGRPSSLSIAPVRSSTARSMATSPFSSPSRPYRRSHPDRSRNISSMLATTTVGA